jgi:hypothetical protein
MNEVKGSNRFRQGNIKLLKKSRHLFGGLISLKKAEIFGVKFGSLKRSQVMAYPGPGLLASRLGNALGQYTSATCDYSLLSYLIRLQTAISSIPIKRLLHLFIGSCALPPQPFLSSSDFLPRVYLTHRREKLF